MDISPYLARAIKNYQSGGTVKDLIYKVADRRELYGSCTGRGSEAATGDWRLAAPPSSVRNHERSTMNYQLRRP